jgi:hypothetical protein
MLVKIAENHYINSDRIEELFTHDNDPCIRFAGNPMPLSISVAAADHLKVILDVNETLVTPEQLAAQPAQSSASKVAQALRDQFPFGATFTQLESILNMPEDQLAFTLGTLLEERIVTKNVEAEFSATLFYHASSAPGTSPVDF